MALQLKKAGIRRVRPLAGGLEAWRARGFPIEPIKKGTPDAQLGVESTTDSRPGLQPGR